MAHQKVLSGVRVAILAADGFEQVELTRPRAQLLEHGAEVEVVSLRPRSIRGMNLLALGKKVKVDRTVFTADPADYDALLIPGGFINPDFLRRSERALELVRAFERAGKPIAAICHGPWVLISAGLVRGRRLTSWPGIRDDVRNAGGIWEDMAVVKDGNWITSRDPGDLPQFERAIVEHLAPGMVARERRRALPMGWIAGVAALGLALLGRRLLREHRGPSWLPEWLEGSKHPGEASLEAFEELVREDIEIEVVEDIEMRGPLAADRAGQRGVQTPTSWP